MPAAHENSGEETSLSDSEPLKPPPQNLTHPDQHRVPVHTHDYEHYPDIHNGAWIPPQSPIYRGPNPVTHSPHAPPTPSDGSHPHQPPPQDIHTQYNPQPYPSNPQYPVYHNDYPANGAKGNGSKVSFEQSSYRIYRTYMYVRIVHIHSVHTVCFRTCVYVDG